MLLIERQVTSYRLDYSDELRLGLGFLSWRFAILRNGPRYRVEIRYTGRPAQSAGEAPNASPPFISILDRHKLHP